MLRQACFSLSSVLIKGPGQTSLRWVDKLGRKGERWKNTHSKKTSSIGKSMELRAITFDSTVIIISSYHVYISHFFVSCCYESNLMWWCSLGSCSITLFWENWMCSTTPHKWCLLIALSRSNRQTQIFQKIILYLIYLLCFSRMLNICMCTCFLHSQITRTCNYNL